MTELKFPEAGPGCRRRGAGASSGQPPRNPSARLVAGLSPRQDVQQARHLEQSLLCGMIAADQEVLGVMVGARFLRSEDRAQALRVDEGQLAQIELDLERARSAEARDRRFQLVR